MRIVAFTPSCEVHRLRSLLAPGQLVEVNGVEQFASELLRSFADWIVIAPTALSSSTWIRIQPVLRGCGGRLVLYCDLSVTSVARILDVQRTLVPELVFHGVDDDWDRLRAALRVSYDSIRSTVAAGLAGNVGRLRWPTRLGVVRLFERGSVITGVADWCSSIGLSDDAVRDHLRRAGLKGPHAILRAAQCSTICDSIIQRGGSLTRAAHVHCNGSLRALERTIKVVIGTTPGEVRGATIPTTELAGRIVRFAQFGPRIASSRE